MISRFWNCLGIHLNTPLQIANKLKISRRFSARALAFQRERPIFLHNVQRPPQILVPQRQRELSFDNYMVFHSTSRISGPMNLGSLSIALVSQPEVGILGRILSAAAVRSGMLCKDQLSL